MAVPHPTLSISSALLFCNLICPPVELIPAIKSPSGTKPTTVSLNSTEEKRTYPKAETIIFIF